MFIGNVWLVYSVGGARYIFFYMVNPSKVLFFIIIKYGKHYSSTDSNNSVQGISKKMGRVFFLISNDERIDKMCNI